MLGIDPGTAILGYGVVAVRSSVAAGGVSLVECGVVRTRAHEPLPARLAVIFDGVAELVERHRPDAIAVEGLFHGRNARSALVLGHARGVVLLAAERAHLPVAEISPAEVKRAVTGTGAATKPQVGAMVMRLLRLAAAPTPADAADGVAIALTHLLRLQPRARLAGPGVRR
ncbi:MAG TPA: crossover junction endodeoxyribonuclease RuvC [Gemmatimonadales bacterium]